MNTPAAVSMTAEEKIEKLRRIYRPDPAGCGTGGIAARILFGSCVHIGYLAETGDQLEIRDSPRKRGQRAFVHEGNVDRVELRQPNGRYASPWGGSA